MCIRDRILLGGSLGDRLGRRRVFVAGTLGFGVASALCGLAPSAEVLVAARALQGIAAGMTFLHAHSVIHRDLKSANVLFNRQLQVIRTKMLWALGCCADDLKECSWGQVDSYATTLVHAAAAASRTLSFKSRAGSKQLRAAKADVPEDDADLPEFV